jgi:hypothetical protein
MLVRAPLEEGRREIEAALDRDYDEDDYALVPGEGWIGFFFFQKKSYIDFDLVDRLREAGREVIALDMGDDAPGVHRFVDETWVYEKTRAREVAAAHGVIAPALTGSSSRLERYAALIIGRTVEEVRAVARPGDEVEKGARGVVVLGSRAVFRNYRGQPEVTAYAVLHWLDNNRFELTVSRGTETSYDCNLDGETDPRKIVANLGISVDYMFPPTVWHAVELGSRVRVGTASAVHEARVAGEPALVTLSAEHASAESLKLEFKGVAPVAWIGRPDGLTFDDALVEVLPRDALPATKAGLSRRAIAALGAKIADLVAEIHRAGVVLDGIQPDLIYVRNGAFAALAPRGPRFIASARRVASGLGAYSVPYLGRETLALGKPAGRPADVFALCASLFVLATGQHPFGALDNPGEILHRTMADARTPLEGGLGQVLSSGLAADPAARPTMDALANLFAAAMWSP